MRHPSQKIRESPFATMSQQSSHGSNRTSSQDSVEAALEETSGLFKSGSFCTALLLLCKPNHIGRQRVEDCGLPGKPPRHTRLVRTKVVLQSADVRSC